MKITGIVVTPITLEWKKVVGESFGTVGKREDDVIVQIFTDDGLYGLGEAMTLGPFYSRESQGTVMTLLTEHIAPNVLLGEDPYNIDLIHYKMNRLVSEHSIAKTAVDVALHDIVGKALGVPVYKLIGGTYTDKLPLHWNFGIGPPEQMVAEAREGIQAGYRALKIKAGIQPRQDVENIKTIREAVGPDISFIVDINQAYDVKMAIKVIRQMEQYDILRVEQPVHYKDLDGMAMVRRAVEVPIGACESAMTARDVVHIIKKEAADFVNLKVMRSGGFYPSKAIVQMATASGMFVVSSTQLGMGIEVAADAHFGASTKEIGPPPHIFHSGPTGILKLFNTVDSTGITKDIVDGTPRIADGFFFVPQAPGLGVELNEENLKFYLTKGKEAILIGENREIKGSHG
jgi:L-alanine-DL-glutamate epimerase-like enolase superfamily enzyme